MIDWGMSAKHLRFPTCCIKRYNQVNVLILISTTTIMIVRCTCGIMIIIKPKMCNSYSKTYECVDFDINNNDIMVRTKPEWCACCMVYNTQVIRHSLQSWHVYHTQKSVNNVVRSRCACCMVHNTQVICHSHWNRHAITTSLSFDNRTMAYVKNQQGVIDIS